MTVDWHPLQQELAHWRAGGETPTFWWRDDDAVAPTRALDRLRALSFELGVPVHLAVIPKCATKELAATCASDPLLVPLIHGWSHENHAPETAKKAEFGHPRLEMMSDAHQSITRMKALFGNKFAPVFVPPWNRIDPDFLLNLPELGFTCLSTFTPRQHRLAAPGLVQINTHIDPIHWRGNRSLVPPQELLALTVNHLRDRRLGRIDNAEPMGFLTHHLVHDDAIWDFSHAFLAALLEGGATPLNLFELKDTIP